MAQTLKFGNKTWATKVGSTLAYNDENDNYKPLPFAFTRSTLATRVNKEGLIEVVTNDRPRIDYTDTSDGVLLLENAATNLVTYSELFESYWLKTNSLTSDNQIISPDGTQNACILTDNSTDGYHNINRIDISPTDSNNYTRSFYVKKGTARYVVISARQIPSSSSTSWIYDFDINNWTSIASSGISQLIEVLDNGWIRLSVTIVSSSNFNNDISIGISSGSSIADSSYIGIGNTLYLWGAQLELGNISSYIPTQGSASTRVAETATDSGNSEVFNSSEGVLHCEISALVNDNNFKAISVSDSSTSDRITLSLYQSSLYAYIADGGVGQFNVSQAVNSIFQYHKVAIKYKTNDCAFWVNGFEVATDTSATMPSGLIELAFDKGDGNDDFYGSTKEIGYYDTILTDLELETLTSYKSWTSMVNELNLNIIYNG